MSAIPERAVIEAPHSSVAGEQVSIRKFDLSETDPRLADVVRGIARDGERLASLNGGRNGFVQVVKNEDGTFDAEFLGGPLQGARAVWGRSEEGILLQTGENNWTHVDWHKPSRTTAGMIDPRVRWVEGR